MKSSERVTVFNLQGHFIELDTRNRLSASLTTKELKITTSLREIYIELTYRKSFTCSYNSITCCVSTSTINHFDLYLITVWNRQMRLSALTSVWRSIDERPLIMLFPPISMRICLLADMHSVISYNVKYSYYSLPFHTAKWTLKYHIIASQILAYIHVFIIKK